MVLPTTGLDVRQWLVCTGVALSIIVAAEIRKALRRRIAAKGHISVVNPRTHNGQKARKSKAALAAVALQIAWHLTPNRVRCLGGQHLMIGFEVRTCVPGVGCDSMTVPVAAGDLLVIEIPGGDGHGALVR